jgi:hypothetical protein
LFDDGEPVAGAVGQDAESLLIQQAIVRRCARQGAPAGGLALEVVEVNAQPVSWAIAI